MGNYHTHIPFMQKFTCNISKIPSGEEYSHSARSFRIQRFAEWLKMISIFLCLIFNVTNNTCILSHSEEIKHVQIGLLKSLLTASPIPELPQCASTLECILPAFKNRVYVHTHTHTQDTSARLVFALVLICKMLQTCTILYLFCQSVCSADSYQDAQLHGIQSAENEVLCPCLMGSWSMQPHLSVFLTASFPAHQLCLNVSGTC